LVADLAAPAETRVATAAALFVPINRRRFGFAHFRNWIELR
jgi:hypothetical protein